MHKRKPVAERHAHMVHELKWRRSSAALGAVDDDEIRGDTGFEHRFHYSEEFPRVSDAKLEAGGLAARKAPELCDELHHLDRRGEGRVPRRRNAIRAHGHVAYAGDLARHFSGRQYSTVARLCPLRELELDHFDFGPDGERRELRGREAAVMIAATEIP